MAKDRYGYRRSRTGPGKLIAAVMILATVGVGAWWHIYRDPSPPPATGKGAGKANGATKPAGKTNGKQPAKPNGKVAGNGGIKPTPKPAKPAKPVKPTSGQQAKAVKYCNEGMKRLEENKPFEARTALSFAVLSGHLPPNRDAQAVQALTLLANKYILSPLIEKRDDYAREYVLTDADSKGLAAVERKLKLHVPWEAMIIVSDPGVAERIHKGLDIDLDALKAKSRRAQVGQRLKTIPGPCHAVIYKSRHLMDLYFHRSGCDKVFLRRMLVGLGKYKGTPAGMWKVVNKQIKPDYFPAPNSPLRKRGRIPYGKEGYAFGKKGLWLGLEGTSESTKNLKGYGIHSTNDPASIGTDASEGCVRVGEGDIDLVFYLLYEQWATVDIRP